MIDGDLARKLGDAGVDLGVMGIQWGRRPDRPPACAVTDRDLRLLRFVHDFGYVGTSTLAAMFWGRYGSAVREQGVKKATTDAGLRGVSAHVLRHTFASILIYQGRDNRVRRSSARPHHAQHDLGQLHPPVQRGQAGRPGTRPARRRVRPGARWRGRDPQTPRATRRRLSRWQTGKGEPAGKLSGRLSVLEAIVDELAVLYPPHRVHDWIFNPHRLLGHAKPAERIQAGRGDEVLAVIAELRDGAFG